MSSPQLTRRHFNQLVAGGLGGLLIAALDGCSEKPVAGGQPAPRDISVAATTTTSVYFAPLLAASSAGAFDAVHLSPHTTSFASSSDTVRAVASGQAAVGIGGILGVIRAAAQAPVKIIGSYFNTTEFVFLAHPDSGINGPADMRGKKAATTGSGGITDFFMANTFDRAGLKKGDVQIVYAGQLPQMVAVFKSRAVDLIISPEPITSQLVSSGDARVVWHNRDYFPNWADGIMFAMADTLAGQHDLLAAYVDGVKRACAHVHEEPDEVAKVWAGQAKIDEAAATRIIGDFTALNNPSGIPTWDVRLSQTALTAASDAAQFLGVAKSSIDWSTVVDQSLLAPGERVSL